MECRGISTCRRVNWQSGAEKPRSIASQRKEKTAYRNLKGSLRAHRLARADWKRNVQAREKFTQHLYTLYIIQKYGMFFYSLSLSSRISRHHREVKVKMEGDAMALQSGKLPDERRRARTHRRTAGAVPDGHEMRENALLIIAPNTAPLWVAIPASACLCAAVTSHPRAIDRRLFFLISSPSIPERKARDAPSEKVTRIIRVCVPLNQPR